jgi:hypothetical protein
MRIHVRDSPPVTGSGAQVPLKQLPPWHEWPHAPQSKPLDWRLTQAPEHQVSPASQTHLPSAPQTFDAQSEATTHSFPAPQRFGQLVPPQSRSDSV